MFFNSFFKFLDSHKQVAYFPQCHFNDLKNVSQCTSLFNYTTETTFETVVEGM